jgi:hypothetical protein
MAGRSFWQCKQPSSQSCSSSTFADCRQPTHFDFCTLFVHKSPSSPSLREKLLINMDGWARRRRRSLASGPWLWLVGLVGQIDRIGSRLRKQRPEAAVSPSFHSLGPEDWRLVGHSCVGRPSPTPPSFCLQVKFSQVTSSQPPLFSGQLERCTKIHWPGANRG